MRLYVFLGYHQPYKLLILHRDDVTSNDVDKMISIRFVSQRLFKNSVDDFPVVPNLIL